MGLKIKPKFDGACEKCGKTWKAQEGEIFWDKTNGTATCSDLECYKSKGGSAIEFPKGGGGKSYYMHKMTDAPEIHNQAIGLTEATIAAIKEKGLEITADNYAMMYLGHWNALSRSYKKAEE